MAAARLGDLKRLIKEALQTWQKERDKHVDPADPVNARPPWPYVGGDKIAARVLLELSTPDKSRKQLIRRLKQFRYPYIARHPYEWRNQGVKSFYRHLKKLGLLDFLLNPPFLWKVRQAWFFRRHYDLEKELGGKARSQNEYPIAFHRRMMLGTSRHLTETSKLARKYGVPRNWFTDYYEATLRQLLREASVCYPELQRWFKPASKIRPHSLGVEVQIDIFDALVGEFAKRKMKNNKLAYQLTALICSCQSCIKKRTLYPNPDTVRTNLGDRKDRVKKNKSEKTRKNPT